MPASPTVHCGKNAIAQIRQKQLRTESINAIRYRRKAIPQIWVDSAQSAKSPSGIAFKIRLDCGGGISRCGERQRDPEQIA